MIVTIFDPSNGLIKGIRSARDIATLDVSPDDFVVGRHDTDFKYVASGGVVSDRPEMSTISVNTTSIAADGIEESIVSGIPDGSSIVVNGEDQGLMTGGSFTITSNVEKSFDVKIHLFPYISYEVKINAS